MMVDTAAARRLLEVLQPTRQRMQRRDTRSNRYHGSYRLAAFSAEARSVL